MNFDGRTFVFDIRGKTDKDKTVEAIVYMDPNTPIKRNFLENLDRMSSRMSDIVDKMITQNEELNQ